MPEPTDTITVDGTTYYRAGSGWRMRGARDVAVGPRFCALLDEIATLTQRLADAEQRAKYETEYGMGMEAQRDAARKDAERVSRLGRLMPVGLVRVEIAGVRQDAERWRFLRLRVGMYDHAAQMVGFVFPWKSLTIGDPDSLDAAIDAACAAEGGTTP